MTRTILTALLVVQVGLAAGTAGAGQAWANAWTPPRTADGQPDLEGVWADISLTPLERPKAFAGRPLLTDDEVRQLQERAERYYGNSSNDFIAGDNLFLTLLLNPETARNPNATGNASIMVRRQVDNRTSLITNPADGRIPPLTPDGVRRLAAGQAAGLALPWQPGAEPVTTSRRLARGPQDLSNALRCITWGVPKIAGNTNYTSHYQIVQAPGYVVLVSEVNHESRVIRLDARRQLPQALTQWNGDSRGHWEGNTLVVETQNFSAKSYFMGAADRLHLIERLTRTGADTIDYEITLSDPSTWTKPWTALIRLTRTSDRIYESACHEGNYVVIEGILGAARADESVAGERR
jgi:peptidoglycan hydrolase-like protein with peptidoglycan-binding domain